jgi:hypothetical protein
LFHTHVCAGEGGFAQEHRLDFMVARNRMLGQEETAVRNAHIYRWVAMDVGFVELRLKFVVFFGERPVDDVAVHGGERY